MEKEAARRRGTRSEARSRGRTGETFGAVTFLSALGAVVCAQPSASAQTRFEFRELGDSRSRDVATPPARADAWGEFDEKSPEYRVGCAVPTSDACQSTAYLATRCGKVQLDNQWTCYSFYGEGFEAQTSAHRVSVIDPKLTPVGIDVVVAQDGSKEQASYVADLTSYVSAQAKTGMGISQELGINPYVNYAASGTKVYSCQEYTAKKTWSVSSLELHVGAKRQDLRYVVDQAFSNSNADWAMAKKHGSLKGLYDMEGKQFTAVFTGVASPKNQFVAGVPANPATKTNAAAPGPSLSASYVKRYGLWGAFMIRRAFSGARPAC